MPHPTTSAASRAAKARTDAPDPGADARARLLASLPVTQTRRTLAGVATSILEGGSGPPVVLLHGPGANAAHWRGVLPRLAKSRRVIAPDLPGHGESLQFDGALDAPRVIAWLDELIAATGSEPVSLAGHLVGGAIAARYALEHPERLARLVLVDTFGLIPFAPPPDFAAALHRYLESPGEETHTQLWRYCAFDLDGLLQRMGADWAPFAAYNIQLARTPVMLAAVGALLQAFSGQMPEADLARISVPTSLIWGRHDLPCPLRVAEEAHRRYGWPLHVVDDAADDPPVERPDAFVEALRSALAGR